MTYVEEIAVLSERANIISAAMSRVIDHQRRAADDVVLSHDASASSRSVDSVHRQPEIVLHCPIGDAVAAGDPKKVMLRFASKLTWPEVSQNAKNSTPIMPVLSCRFIFLSTILESLLLPISRWQLMLLFARLPGFWYQELRPS
jgi:hypothetical protein